MKSFHTQPGFFLEGRQGRKPSGYRWRIAETMRLWSRPGAEGA